MLHRVDVQGGAGEEPGRHRRREEEDHLVRRITPCLAEGGIPIGGPNLEWDRGVGDAGACAARDRWFELSMSAAMSHRPSLPLRSANTNLPVSAAPPPGP